MSYQEHKSHYMHYIHIIKPFLHNNKKNKRILFSASYLRSPSYVHEHRTMVHRTYIESLNVRLQTQKTIFLYHKNEFMSKQKINFFIYEYVHNFVPFFSSAFIVVRKHNKNIIKFQYHENECERRC